jgi:ribonuclease P protein component
VSGNTLSKNQRLIKASQFREAFAQKRSFVGRTMVLWLRRGEGASLRLGVVTSKKVSNRAVDRNRARRVLRAVFREHRAEFSGEVDVVIIARRNILSAGYHDVEAEFLRLAGKAGLAGAPKHEIPAPEGNPNG